MKQSSSPPNIVVKHSGVIMLKCFDDAPDGMLVIVEAQKTIPFEIKRIYFITNLENPEAIRGKHAHKQLCQYLFCIQGTFRLILDDGETKQDIVMNDPRVGVLLGPKLWHTMTAFSRDCVLLVLASDYYDKSDYIRDYEEFLSYTFKDSL